MHIAILIYITTLLTGLLVAPVTMQGATSRNVYFPPGAWTHFFTGDVEHGPAKKKIEAPLEHFPAYFSGPKP